MGSSTPIRYAAAKDGVRIAFWAAGQGDPLVVMPEPVLFSIEADLSHPSSRGWYERLARDRMVVRFDTRGSGLSEHDGAEYSIAALQLDLDAVVDALGLATFNLMGHEDATQVAIAYCVRAPERVRSLVLWSAFAASADLPQSAALQTMEQLIGKNSRVWADVLVHTIYSWKGEEAAGYAASLAESVPADAAAAMLRAAWEWSVADLLPRVGRPTLVMQRKDQIFFPVRLGVGVAGSIDGARLAIFDGSSALPWAGAQEDCARTIDEFISSVSQEHGKRTIGRMLASVLFVDIVASTEKAVELGDARWQKLLQELHGLLRRELRNFGGLEIDTAGDGLFATFERPELAIRCAGAMVEAVRAFGLQLRAGIHTGEVETDGRHVRGVGVHVGARVASLAKANEVLVTRTVRELVSGSGIEFADRGEHQLKGIPGTWGVHVVVRS